MINEKKVTHTLQFNKVSKTFEDTKNVTIPEIHDGSYIRLNTWIKNFLQGISFIHNGYIKNTNIPYTPFYIYCINFKTYDTINNEIHENIMIYPKPLTEFHKYIEEWLFYSSSKIFLDIYVTFNKNENNGKIIHLYFDKNINSLNN